jgi:membrane fusion protein, multidrug efflux system
MLKSTGYFILFAVFISFTACKGKKSDGAAPGGGAAKQPPIVSEGLIVNPQALASDIEVPGTLMASESVEIHPEVSGRVVQMNLKEGNYVNKGALLVKLYDGDLQAQLRKIEVQLKIAEQTEKRQNELLKIQGISQQDYDLSLLQVNNLKADMDIIKTSISKTEIRSPFNGRIGLRNISPGAYITPTTAITTISQVSQLKLQFNVPEKYGAQLTNGQHIGFNIDGSAKNFSAVVMAKEVMIDENTRSLAIRSLVTDRDAALIPGAFAKVKLQLGQQTDAIMVPTIAVLPQGRKKQVFVFNGGKAVAKEITTGVRDANKVQVLTGLNNGDTVITTGVLFLRPGADVKLSKVN